MRMSWQTRRDKQEHLKFLAWMAGWTVVPSTGMRNIGQESVSWETGFNLSSFVSLDTLTHFSFFNHNLKRLENFTVGSFLPWIVCNSNNINKMGLTKPKGQKHEVNQGITENPEQTEKGMFPLPWFCCTERNYPGEKGMWVWGENGTAFPGACFTEAILCLLYSLEVCKDPLPSVYLVYDQDGIAEHWKTKIVFKNDCGTIDKPCETTWN